MSLIVVWPFPSVSDQVSNDFPSERQHNVLATLKNLEKDPRVVELYKLLTSAETEKYMMKTWGGLVVPVRK